ncbi:MAG: four helix bundle protein [Candidatus Omnitrophica bacterium CG07_land_8_20_14_0_80_42_15]|uniref:Four helix bundle protein n=1 Tax=Candidatus Aquitaenariimonas noxiae TaxID=1974741 RepID=A0A2J0L076_9BACT|nr:MAG: four helix bundle protein [Candidatus Omnitrophica bacterium CG07_land_8_20_14_0_80_42_15]
MFRFEDLDIWKLAIEYADELYDLIQKLPTAERYNLTDQLRRAALSISNNIAEGSGVSTIKSFSSFLDISISSALEAVNLLHFASRRGFVPEDERSKFYTKAETLIKKIRAFKNSLK